MYGMSHFSLQLNYFPSWLHNVVPPTDTRRRPDQRALENGNMIDASAHKDRLEKKQRSVRKAREAKGIEHSPMYFQPVEVDEDDSQVYYKYNYKYFEDHRVAQNWKGLPDLFTE